MFGPGATPTTRTASAPSTVRWTRESISSTPRTCTPRESEEIVAEAFGGTPRRHHPGHQVSWRHGRGPEPVGQLPPLDHPRGRELPPPTQDRLDRPLPGPPAPHRHRHRGDPLRLTILVHQGKVRYIGSSTFPASQIVEAQWVARERNLQRFVTEQPPYSILVRHTEADTPAYLRRHGMGVLTYSPLAGGWLSGRWRKDTDLPTPSPARQRLVNRYDMSLLVNQRKLDAAEALGQLAEEAGLSLIEMAIAFVLNHPAVTSAIIGPRTMEQLESQLPRPTSTSPPTCWTASTRSSHPAP